jgi:HK97 gp10 family phage protein
MNDEDDILGLNQLIEGLGGIVNLTVEEREEVTQAQADVLVDNLQKATKSKHYSERKVSKKDVQHLADSITSGNLEGAKEDGDTAVGFTTKDANHARIARMLNDGTKKMKGDSFYDEARDSATDKVQQVGAEVLKKIQDKKMG